MEINRGIGKVTNSGIRHDRALPQTMIKEQQGLESNFKTNEKLKVEEVKQKVDSLNQFLKVTNTQLKFNFHEELNEYYVTIIDENTKEIVKEIPPKKLLDMYAAMKDTLGLFIDKKI
jgi:flagellar protein FlaG